MCWCPVPISWTRWCARRAASSCWPPKTGQTNAFFFDAAGHQILSLDIRVEKDVTDLATMMKADLPNSAVKVSAMNDNVVLSGQVASALESTRAADLAASFAGDPKKVVNMLSVAGGEQVMLKVRIAEMDRSIAKQFGVNMAAARQHRRRADRRRDLQSLGLLGHALSNASGGQIGASCGAAFVPTGTGTITTTVTNNVSTNPAPFVPPWYSECVSPRPTTPPIAQRPTTPRACSRRWSRWAWCICWPSPT